MVLSELARGTKTGLSAKLTSASKIEKLLPGIRVYSNYNRNLSDAANKPPLVPLEDGKWEYAASRLLGVTLQGDKGVIYANEYSVQTLHTSWLNEVSRLLGSGRALRTEEKAAVTDAVELEYEGDDGASGLGGSVEGGDSPGVDQKVKGQEDAGAGALSGSPKKHLTERKVVRAIVNELPVRVPGKYSGKQENCYLEYAPDIGRWLRKTGIEAKIDSMEGDEDTEIQVVLEVGAFALANMRAVWGTARQNDMKSISCSNLVVDGTGGLRGAWFVAEECCNPEHAELVKGTIYLTPYYKMLNIPHATSNFDKSKFIKAGPEFLEGFQVLLSAMMPEVVTMDASKIAHRIGEEAVEFAQRAIGEIQNAITAKGEQAKATLIAEQVGPSLAWATQALGLQRTTPSTNLILQQANLRLEEARAQVALWESAIAAVDNVKKEEILGKRSPSEEMEADRVTKLAKLATN